MDVLYSLFDVNNQRLVNITQENTFTNTLNFVFTTLTDDILSISDPIIDRFFMNILPRIHYNVKSLILNSLSRERILASDYPNLSELKIFNVNVKVASHYFTDQQVECMIKYRRFPDVKYHLFSLPFMFDGLQFLDNTFPNIIFNHVIRLVVDDNIPFEHEFFMRIAWCFPLLKVLTVYNATSQSPILNYNDNQLYPTTIEYPYLTSLYLLLVHGDYVNRFLNDRKTHLPHLTVLSVNYNDLRNVTRNFTNDRIRLNCIQLKQLSIGPQKIAHSEDFYAYFPLL
ncbi:unnamed protein product [Rotaria sp. Silwood1]|nr:unnamed protein product [Rotaria sp. Silwood1]CAF1062318.1 unnamed protein product [Rotaria sp. Silwood1]